MWLAVKLLLAALPVTMRLILKIQNAAQSAMFLALGHAHSVPPVFSTFVEDEIFNQTFEITIRFIRSFLSLLKDRYRVGERFGVLDPKQLDSLLRGHKRLNQVCFPNRKLVDTVLFQ